MHHNCEGLFLPNPFAVMMHFVLRSGDAHEEFDILDWNPTRKHLHGVLKIGFQNDVAHPVDQCGRCCM